ncbi:hypothetical protein Slin14017_G022180 [Septoria linicola]|nr:hypothetical protein Slin14017_G022180 [Septoria linicola]
MEPATAVSAVSAALTSTVKLTEKVFEIRAVDKQARSLLETINEVNGQLDVAKDLRRQKSGLLTVVEKKMMDTTYQSTELAIGHVAKLVEPCRVAMQTTGGDVGLGTRLMFVLRDSPNIQVSLTRLGLASQSLHTALILLCSREAVSPPPVLRSTSEPKMPPSYEESQFLTASRAKNMLRKASSTISSDDAGDYERMPGDNMLASLPEDADETADSASISSHTRRGSRSTQNELFFEDAASTHDRFTPRYSGQFLPFLPYRPGPSSTVSAQSEPGIPTMLRPGSTRSPSIPVANGFPEISMWRAHANAEMYGRGVHLSPYENEPSRGTAQAADTSEAHETRQEAARAAAWNSSPPLWAAAYWKPIRRPMSLPQPGSIRAYNANSTKASLAELSAMKSPDQHRTFAFPSNLTDLTPRPLFSEMVKIEDGAKSTEAIQRVEVNLTSKLAADTKPKAALESEFPEVMPYGGLELALPYPSHDNQTPQAVMPDNPAVETARSISIVTEVPVVVMNAARQHRRESVRDAHKIRPKSSQPVRYESGLMLAAETDTSNPIHARRASEGIRLRSATVSPVSLVSSVSLKPPVVLTGRARSQRRREAQFERFEQLQKSQSQ